MGILNWMMHKNMRKVAEQCVKTAATTYSSLRVLNPNMSEQDLRAGVLDKLGNFPVESRRQYVLATYGTSLHGICYAMGLATFGGGLIVSRCVQFTQYVDIEFERYNDMEFGRAGFLPPATEMKRGYFKALKLPEYAVDKDFLHPC